MKLMKKIFHNFLKRKLNLHNDASKRSVILNYKIKLSKLKIVNSKRNELYKIMWKVKQLVDPKGILNPDVLLSKDNKLN